jgi:hypothetical protein
MAKSDLPPVPREGQTTKGPGGGASPGRAHSDIAKADKRERNLEQQGRQGNIHENTRHQGYQQDR